MDQGPAGVGDSSPHPEPSASGPAGGAGPCRAALIVLYTARLEACRRFYTGLGLSFTEEQHGRGPRHHAAVLADGLVLELYPARPGRETGPALRLGFAAPAPAAPPGLPPGRHVLTDPDGRPVDVEVRAE